MKKIILLIVLCIQVCCGQNNDIAIPDIPASVVLNQDISTFLRNSSLRKIAVSVGQNVISGDRLSPFGFEYSFNKYLSVSVGSSINSNRKIGFGVKWTIIDSAEVIKNEKFSNLNNLMDRLNDLSETATNKATDSLARKYRETYINVSLNHPKELDTLANNLMKSITTNEHYMEIAIDSISKKYSISRDRVNNSHKNEVTNLTEEFLGGYEILSKKISESTKELSWAKTNLSFAAAMSVGSTNEEWKNLNIDSSYRIQVWTTYSRQIESWFQVQGGATFLTQKTFNTDSTSGGLNLTSFLGSNETKGSLQLSGRWGNHSPIGKIDINGEFNIGENQWIVLGVKWETGNHIWTPMVDFKTGLSNN